MMVDLKTNAITPTFDLALTPLLGQNGVVLVRLAMTDGRGCRTLPQSVLACGQGRRLPQAKQPALGSAQNHSNLAPGSDEATVELQVGNTGQAAALLVKATHETSANHQRLLPAYADDNYISLLPGETQTIRLSSASTEPLTIGLHGWNPEGVLVPVKLVR